MTKWDYLLLNIVRSYGMNYRVNGEKVSEWKDLPLHDVFRQIGLQGYELVMYDGENYVFKRPRMQTQKLASLPSKPAAE